MLVLVVGLLSISCLRAVILGFEVFCEGHMDATMPTVAFFAAKHIEAYTELTFDYGPSSEFAAHHGFEAKAAAEEPFAS